jgi:hypothetical protein
MSDKVGAGSASFSSKTLGLEQWLDETVNKKQPLQLPLSARAWIADNSWWLAIIGGVLSLWGAWSFWQIGHYLSGLNQLANEVARLSGSSYSTDLGVMWYVALIGLVIEGALLLLAVSPLKAHKKTGWDLLFYVSLVNLVVGVVYILVPGYGLGSLIGSLIGAAISWFFLFQIRSRFAQ